MKEERNPLGYLINSPLPTFLKKEDIVKNVTYTPEEKEKDITGALDSLTNFLNSDTVLSNGRVLAEKHGKDFNSLPSIDESVFVKTWLPHFYHDKEGASASITQGWVTQISGSPYTPVNVMREGKIIYRVPPSLGSMNIISGNDRMRSVALMYKDFENTVARVPHATEVQSNYLCNNVFTPKNTTMHQSELMARRNLKYIYIMDEIFTYYGYETILTPELMSIKQQVMGTDYNEYYTSGAVPQSKSTTGSQPASPLEDDDDLFGDFG